MINTLIENYNKYYYFIALKNQNNLYQMRSSGGGSKNEGAKKEPRILKYVPK